MLASATSSSVGASGAKRTWSMSRVSGRYMLTKGRMTCPRPSSLPRHPCEHRGHGGEAARGGHEVVQMRRARARVADDEDGRRGRGQERVQRGLAEREGQAQGAARDRHRVCGRAARRRERRGAGAPASVSGSAPLSGWNTRCQGDARHSGVVAAPAPGLRPAAPGAEESRPLDRQHQDDPHRGAAARPGPTGPPLLPASCARPRRAPRRWPRAAAPPPRPRPPRAGTSTNGRTWPPPSSTVQTGSAIGVAMPSVAFLAKPCQTSAASEYMRQEASGVASTKSVLSPRGTGRARQRHPVMARGADGRVAAHRLVGQPCASS